VLARRLLSALTVSDDSRNARASGHSAKSGRDSEEDDREADEGKKLWPNYVKLTARQSTACAKMTKWVVGANCRSESAYMQSHYSMPMSCASSTIIGG